MVEAGLGIATENTPLVGRCNFSSTEGGIEICMENGNGEHRMSNGNGRNCKKQHVAKIGMTATLALFVNELTGPGMLQFPATFQQSGLIPTSAMIIIVCALSAYCSIGITEVISRIPGNLNFTQEVEYSAAFQYYVGEKAFILTQIIFFTAIMCQTLASIVDTAQVVDSFLGNHLGTVGVRFFPQPISIIWWEATHDCERSNYSNGHSGRCIAFNNPDDGQLILTLGYIMSAIIFIPIGRLDLEGNMFWQIVSFYALLICTTQFLVSFLMNGIDSSNLSMWGSGEGKWDGLIGIVLFNFAIVTAIPSWLYEKAPSVNVMNAINVSCIMSAFLYILFGALGALAIKDVPNNVLTSLSSGELGPVTTFFSSTFCFFIIGFGIPLFSILMRLNLVGSNICSEDVGKLLTVSFPWYTGWLLYQGSVIKSLLSTGGILTSFIVFIGPLWLVLLVSFRRKDITLSREMFIGNSKLAEQIELVLISIFMVVLVTIGLFSS